MKNLITLVSVATFATCVFTLARADTSSEPRSETVQFADLNAANVHGAAVLFQRIKSAAENVCRDLEPGRSLALQRPYAECVHVALSNAVAKVDSPAVTAYAVARGALQRDTPIKIAGNK